MFGVSAYKRIEVINLQLLRLSWEPSGFERCARRLAAGRIKESEVTGRMMSGRKPARCWYISGIVLEPEIAGGAAIRALFSQGIGSWFRRGNIEFP